MRGTRQGTVCQEALLGSQGRGRNGACRAQVLGGQEARGKVFSKR